MADKKPGNAGVEETPRIYFDCIKPLERMVRFQNLPVPRLQAEWLCHPGGRDFAVCRYGLVRTHHSARGVQILHVFDETRRTGNLTSPGALLEAARKDEDYGLPFRVVFHIRHDCHEMRLPAFLVVGEHVVRLDEYVLPSPTGYMRRRDGTVDRP